MENDKIRNSRDLEVRLVTSAWQKLISTLNSRSTDERVSSVGSSSFLSQKRHLPNSSISSNSSNSSNNSATSVSGSPSSSPGLIHHSLSATNTPRQRSSNSFLSKQNETDLKSLEEKLELLSVEKNELKESREKELKAHEKEIKEMNEKYRGYLEKAKIVIQTLDPRNSTNECSELQFLKTQLAEKDKQIKQLTKENDKIRKSRDQEERLVASAWQKLSSKLNPRSKDERVSSVGSSSFLSQKRHFPNSNSRSNSSTSSNNSATSVSGSLRGNGALSKQNETALNSLSSYIILLSSVVFLCISSSIFACFII